MVVYYNDEHNDHGRIRIGFCLILFTKEGAGSRMNEVLIAILSAVIAIAENSKDKEIKSVSYLIARKITKMGFYGTTSMGKHPLQNAIEEADRLGIIDEIIDCVVEGFEGKVDIEFEKI